MKLSLHRIISFGLLLLTVSIVSCSGNLTSQPMLATETSVPTDGASTTPSSTPAKTHTPSLFPALTTVSPIAPSFWVWKDNWPKANQIRALLFDEAGDLWAGGPGGLVHWHLSTGQHEIFVSRERPEASKVVALAQTPDNVLWIGTFGNGVSRLDAFGQLRSFTTNDGLPSNYITSLIATQNGTLWVDTFQYATNQKPARGDFGQFDGYHWVPKVGGGFYKIVAGSSGDIWALTLMQIGQDWDSSVASFNGKAWNVVRIVDRPLMATAITVAPDGTVWVAAETGVFRFDGHAWHTITPPWIGKTVANVTAIEVLEDGSAWFGFSLGAGLFGDQCGDRITNQQEWGVYRYDGRNWTHFTTENGLVDNKICAITTGPDGNIWFGSYDKGISRFDGKKWTSFVIP